MSKLGKITHVSPAGTKLGCDRIRAWLLPSLPAAEGGKQRLCNCPDEIGDAIPEEKYSCYNDFA
jgi:hypothetical protein